MKKTELKRLLTKNMEAINQHLESFLTTEKQDQLHQLRVQIKKLKSLLVLFTASEKNKKLLQIFKPVKRIFHHAGIIRDAYIHLQLADQFEVRNPAFRQQQTKLMSDQIVTFCQQGRKYIKEIDSTGKKLKKELRTISNTHITNFYESEVDGVVLTLAKREFNQDMHDCRKRIKNLLYNQKLASKSLSGNFKLNVPYLNQVQEALGQWHDSILARDLFSTQMQDERQAIDQLNLQISKQEKSIIRISANFWKTATNGTLDEKKTS